MFDRFKKKTKQFKIDVFGSLVKSLVRKKSLSKETLVELENKLLLADVGVETTKQILKRLNDLSKGNPDLDPSLILVDLKQFLTNILTPFSQPLIIPPTIKPFIILMVGVNGSGKTTTIAKLAHLLKQQGHKILLAAGDTFRAAAIEQLEIWGQRLDLPVIAQQSGADSAAVIYDAVQAAKARDYDVVIADTSGRLHTKEHLMEELSKIKRVLNKIDVTYPHEVQLVLDASIGQNALNQAKQFQAAIPITGISITKLDGTAKGGIIFAITQSLGIPIRFIGVGEDLEDLYPFDATQFVEALYGTVA